MAGQGSDSSPPATVADNVRLDGLRLQLGPELRAMYPVVLNLGISGDLLIDGPADPDFVRLAGTMHLDSGEVYPAHANYLCNSLLCHCYTDKQCLPPTLVHLAGTMHLDSCEVRQARAKPLCDVLPYK